MFEPQGVWKNVRARHDNDIESQKLCHYSQSRMDVVTCTDGVTEAPNRQAEEYGEVRLAELIRENKDSSVDELLATVQASVQEFSGDTPKPTTSRSSSCVVAELQGGFPPRR